MIDWFKKHLNKLVALKEKNQCFRLVNINGTPENKNLTITYQVRGKATVVTEELGKMVDDLLILKGFSKSDSEAIYSFAVAEKEAPDYKISNILFEADGSYLRIIDIRTSISFTIKTTEIFMNLNIIEKLSSKSLIAIMTLYSSESMTEQNKILKQKKAPSLPASLRVVK